MRLLASVAIAVLVTAPNLAAQLAGRPAEEWIKTLDGTTRVSSLKLDDVVAAMKLKPGETVADIGAGSGLFSVPAARAVGPKGRVYAVEVDAGFFAAIKKRASDAGVGNVQTVLGEFTDPKLPVKTIDIAFFHDVLHHIDNRGPYLKTLASYLGPMGRIVVIDFEGGRGPHAAQQELQVPREQLTKWMADAGLKPDGEAKLFDDKYVLTFVKK